MSLCQPHEIVIAESDGAMIGFVTVDPHTLYLDQIVVAPEHWGSGVGAALIAEAKTYFAERSRSRRQHRQCARYRLLRQARICRHRRRQKSDQPASRFTA